MSLQTAATQREFQFYQTNNGPCPYLPVGLWENLSFYAEHLPPEVYESLLNQGFRRSGYSIYHPICQGCQCCIPLRVRASHFVPSKNQRRTWKHNQDLRMEHHPVHFSDVGFDLYRKYQVEWHHAPEVPDEWEYRNFLLESPVPSEMILYFWQETLIGIGWVDLLSSLLSSVYFIFDPHHAARRLGVFSLLYEIHYAQQLGKEWLYLGYWVEDSPKMQYKAAYHPAEILLKHQWLPLADYKAK